VDSGWESKNSVRVREVRVLGSFLRSAKRVM